MLVLLATALGARVIAGADDRIPMYAAAVALKPGDRLSADSVRRVEVQLDEAVARYLSASNVLPPQAYLLREVRAGELIPASAVGTQEQVSVQPVAVRVDAGSVSGLVVGSVVDVWVSPRDLTSQAERYTPATKMLTAVTVGALPTDQTRFGVGSASASVQLLVGLGDVPTVITAADAGSRFTLVAVPGSARSRP